METKGRQAHPMTLTQSILEEQHHHPKAQVHTPPPRRCVPSPRGGAHARACVLQGDLTVLLHAIEIASKFVSSQVRAAGIFDLYGVEGSTNVQGYASRKRCP